MIGRQEVQEALFYRFRIEDDVPVDHLLRRTDWLLDFGTIRHEPDGKRCTSPTFRILS